MNLEERIKELLLAVVHPETEVDIVTSGIVEQLSCDEGHIALTLRFAKSRDPFALKIKERVQDLLTEQFSGKEVRILIKEGAAARPQAEKRTTTGGVGRVIAVASGKGGVGKSTVTANLAVALRNMGYRVGVLDADIYGPSQNKMFGVEGYLPDAVQKDGIDQIIPAESLGIKVMSIGFFVKPNDALLWRGAMAVNALKQLIHQTQWGELDFLLVDLPPGTGDIHLSIIGELQLSAAVIVSTPQQVAVADVLRGVEMFRHANVNVPIAGVIENMAWFSPEELPENSYYIFGQGGARKMAEACGVEFLGEIPIIQSIMEGADGGKPAAGIDSRVEKYYREIARKVVDKA